MNTPLRITLDEPNLAPRLRHIARMLAVGFTPTEIALILGRSIQTVKNQMLKLKRQLGARSQLEVVAAVYQHPDWFTIAATQARRKWLYPPFVRRKR